MKKNIYKVDFDIKPMSYFKIIFFLIYLLYLLHKSDNYNFYKIILYNSNLHVIVAILLHKYCVSTNYIVPEICTTSNPTKIYNRQKQFQYQQLICTLERIIKKKKKKKLNISQINYAY